MAGVKGRSGRKKGAKVGPYKNVDLQKLHALALIGTSIQRMAVLLGVSHDLLERRYRPDIDAARTEGERQILRTTFQHALRGNTRLLELCLINRCGWTNRPEVLVNVTQNTLAVDARSPEQIKAHLVELQKAILQEAKRFELGDNGNANP